MINNLSQESDIRNRDFAHVFSRLIKTAGLKNAVLAMALGYDVSYISKWMGGKTLPAEKSMGIIARQTAELCISELTDVNLDHLESELETKFDRNDISGSIENLLLSSYEATRFGNIESLVQKNNVSQRSKETTGVIQYSSICDIEKSVNLLVESFGRRNLGMIDFLSLEKQSRLLLARIEKGHFVFKEKDKNIQYDLIISIDEENYPKGRIGVYDSIFIIHMLTSLSSISFKLYNSSAAAGAFYYVADDEFFATGGLINNGSSVVGLSYGKQAEQAEDLKKYLEQFTIEDRLIFRSTSIEEMTRTNEYAKSLISTNVRWLLGHITEFLLPKNVFEKLLSDLADNTELKEKRKLAESDIENFRKLYTLADSVIRQEGCHTLIYESALSELACSGEVDFYNNKMILDKEQRKQVLQHILEIDTLRLVDGGFSTDFRYITNPCVFFSDSICYVRLENGRYEDNILVLSDRAVRNMFGSFCEEIWCNCPDVVISDENLVKDKVWHYTRQTEFID